jgi:hypothetical protein
MSLQLPKGGDSSVGIAASYGLDGRGSIPRQGEEIVLYTAFRPALAPTQPPIQWVPGALFPG